LGGGAETGWLRGLKVAAVAVVAQAVWSMGRALCPDWPRRAFALAAAGLLCWLPMAWIQMATIAVGAMLGWVFFQRSDTSPQAVPPSPVVCRGTALICLILFFVLLGVLPLLAMTTGSPWLEVFDRFYRAGS